MFLHSYVLFGLTWASKHKCIIMNTYESSDAQTRPRSPYKWRNRLVVMVFTKKNYRVLSAFHINIIMSAYWTYIEKDFDVYHCSWMNVFLSFLIFFRSISFRLHREMFLWQNTYEFLYKRKIRRSVYPSRNSCFFMVGKLRSLAHTKFQIFW